MILTIPRGPSPRYSIQLHVERWLNIEDLNRKCQVVCFQVNGEFRVVDFGHVHVHSKSNLRRAFPEIDLR